MAVTTNLALRPFRNERLPWILAGLVIAVAVSITWAHGRVLTRLLSGGEARTVSAVLQDEARIAELERALANEPPLKLDAAEMARLGAFKELVDRRVFPWRHLLGELEGLLSDDVRLTTISPATVKGVKGMVLNLSGEARTKDAAFSFAESLHTAPAFSNAVLKSLSDTDSGVDFDLEVVFVPVERDPELAARAGSRGRVAPPPFESSSGLEVTP